MNFVARSMKQITVTKCLGVSLYSIRCYSSFSIRRSHMHTLIYWVPPKIHNPKRILLSLWRIGPKRAISSSPLPPFRPIHAGRQAFSRTPLFHDGREKNLLTPTLITWPLSRGAVAIAQPSPLPVMNFHSWLRLDFDCVSLFSLLEANCV